MSLRNCKRDPFFIAAYQSKGDGTWGENWSFYVLDPDKHRIEIFCEMAEIDNCWSCYIMENGKKVPDKKAEEI